MSDSTDVWVRAFVAIEISDEVRTALVKAQQSLKRRDAHVGWVAPANVHLTLAFLGNVEPGKLQAIGGELDLIGADTPAFSFEVKGIGSFGGRRPKVVWAGVEEGSVQIEAVQKRVDTALRSLGFVLEDRPFLSHLTLGRVRSSRGSDALVEGIADWESSEFGRCGAARILLMRSQLRPEGPTYSVLHESPLRAV